MRFGYWISTEILSQAALTSLSYTHFSQYYEATLKPKCPRWIWRDCVQFCACFCASLGFRFCPKKSWETVLLHRCPDSLSYDVQKEFWFQFEGETFDGRTIGDGTTTSTAASASKIPIGGPNKEMSSMTSHRGLLQVWPDWPIFESLSIQN